MYSALQWYKDISCFELSWNIWVTLYFWFQTFATFWMLYVLFWVIPRHLNSMCRRFGTRCLFHLHRPMKMKLIGCSKTSAHKSQTPRNYPEESIQLNCICFLLLGMFPKLWKATLSFIMAVHVSIHLSAWNNTALTGWIFHEVWYLRGFFENLLRKFKFH